MKSYLHEVPESFAIGTPSALASFSSIVTESVASMALEPRESKKLKRADAQKHITCQD